MTTQLFSVCHYRRLRGGKMAAWVLLGAMMSLSSGARGQEGRASADPSDHVSAASVDPHPSASIVTSTAPANSVSVFNLSGSGINTNQAFNPNPGTAAQPIFPHPFESDPGGSYPQDLLDGYRSCALRSLWDCGLAFTGGNANWGGQACGVRQATIDFGRSVQVSAVKITHHDDEHVPKIYQIQIWTGSGWTTVVNQQNNTIGRCTRPPGYDPASNWVCMITDEFPPAATSKVRYTFNNCPNANQNILGNSITHGWLYEFEAYRLP